MGCEVDWRAMDLEGDVRKVGWCVVIWACLESGWFSDWDLVGMVGCSYSEVGF